MNYIILNGKNSNMVQGLLIQSLPPITKPLLRTEIEEIDGRDGDIVTPLGYSAYDKSMTIGLYGNFKIDDVIKYFDSQGIVTFSNEPYKYYKYQMIAQIDFERLVRYRTATVTFHVQPFKWSTIEGELTIPIEYNLLKVNDQTMTKNGVKLTVSDGHIYISGNASSETEFYVPIPALTLGAGNYTLNADSQGTGSSATSIRMIQQVPSNAQSFGGAYVTLQDSETVSINDDIDEPITYNYLWFYITSGTEMDFTLDVDVVSNNEQSITVQNNGNTKSKPVITIHGTGTINLNLNGSQIFVIDLGSDDSITIDVEQMDASYDGVLKNRFVTGDYNHFLLDMGENEISWSGEVTEIQISKYSRWI